MIRYPQVVSALFTALPKRRQGGAELRFGPRGSSRHGFAPLFKTSQLYHFSLHPVSRKAFRSAEKTNQENLQLSTLFATYKRGRNAKGGDGSAGKKGSVEARHKCLLQTTQLGNRYMGLSGKHTTCQGSSQRGKESTCQRNAHAL